MYETPIRILLVEDSPSDAYLLRQMFLHLGKKGWEFVQVERLSDAIATCRQVAIDVVLLDLILPDSNRLNTLVNFQAAVPDIPIVVLTIVSDETLALQAVAQGAQDYLFKEQITPQLLVRAIGYAIERGQILKQLRESERRWRGIFDQTFQCMVLLTPEGTLLEINQTALDLHGAQLEDCMGLPLWEVSWWNYSLSSQEWLQTAIANARQGHLVREEVQLRGAENKMMWIDFSLKSLKDERGEVVLLIAEGRDISDKKRAETEILKALEQERELHQLKSDLVSVVSHEFRTPLTTIRSSTELLQRYCRDYLDEKKNKHFHRILFAINQMVQLLNDVLFIGKVEAGKLKFQPVALDLVALCRNLVEELQSNAKSQQAIAFTPQCECTNVYMDENLLRTILTNLLSNAIKYSPQGGMINFELSCQDEVATFRIQDRGIGIPLKDRSQLFESFYRASNVGAIQGTGLGLSIVKKSVDLHGGQITVESTVGVGTTFTIRLPLHTQATLS
jgi:PAS domain S-box-containing protein